MPGDSEAIFAGIEFLANIAHVEIEELGINTERSFFEDLRFEATVPVPEPAIAVMLLLVGSIVVGVRRLS